MPDESEHPTSLRSVRVALPWVLAGGMLGIYLLTLHYWVSPESLGPIASLSGLDWRAKLFGPVTWLVTLPIRLLPAAWIPLVLNMLSAAGGALSLAWLARSVCLLPDDRTPAQRHRQPGKSPGLAIRQAWLPPALAVLACGLELTFWEQSVAATGEMVDLVMFAYLIRCLLEVRADGNLGRLPRFAFVLGLAVANTWAMAAFAPLLVLGALWAARANPFALPFLERVLEGFHGHGRPLTVRLGHALQPFNLRQWARSACGFGLGVSLILLLPLAASWPDDSPTEFWPALHLILRTYKTMLLGWPTAPILILCLPAVLPALFLTIRWSRFVGGAGGASLLASSSFHLIHASFLGVCLAIAMDSVLSPRRLVAGAACLPLYYLAALGTGYYSGYFLLVFGTAPSATRRPIPLWARWLRQAPAAAVWVVLAAVAVGLSWKNLPHILQTRHGAMEIYAKQLDQCLPPAGAVILGDVPFHLLCVETALIRRGLETAYLTLDTVALAQDASYFEFVRRKHPAFNLVLPFRHLASDLTNPAVLTSWVEDLAAGRPVYCLRPISGFLGESFIAQPRGLFYELIPRGTNALERPRLPTEAMAANASFWQAFTTASLPGLARRLHPPERPQRPGRWQRLRQAAHLGPEPDPWGMLFAAWWSQGLDAWGVELQQEGRLAEAGGCFEAALRLSPDNVAAQINRRFNQDLQARKPIVIEAPERFQSQLGKRRSWEQVLALDGPVDEPNSCYHLGMMFAETGLPRQAILEFARARSLAPGYPGATLLIADQFLHLSDYGSTLAEADRALQIDAQSHDGLFLKGFSLLQLAKYAEALPPLTQLLTLDADEQRARLARAWVCLRLGDLEGAQHDFEFASKSPTNAYYGWYGLAEVAGRRKDAAAVTRYGDLFLSSAPASFPEADRFKARLTDLRKGDIPSPDR